MIISKKFKINLVGDFFIQILTIYEILETYEMAKYFMNNQLCHIFRTIGNDKCCMNNQLCDILGQCELAKTCT